MMIRIEGIPIVGARLAAMPESTRAIENSRSRQPRMLQTCRPHALQPSWLIGQMAVAKAIT